MIPHCSTGVPGSPPPSPPLVVVPLVSPANEDNSIFKLPQFSSATEDQGAANESVNWIGNPHPVKRGRTSTPGLRGKKNGIE